MFELKPISKESVAQALERAMRYRLLNEPMQAESICLDVLNVDPDNQEATVSLLLSLTDQLDVNIIEAFQEAVAVLPRISDKYSRVYYEGILYERRAKSHHRRKGMGTGFVAFDWFHKAMECYERAEKLSPAGNDEAILRWNCCARLILRDADLKPRPEAESEHMLE